MIQKADIIKMAKHVFKRGRGVPDKKLQHPGREWAIGLAVFVAVLSAGGFVSVSLFERYNNLHETDIEIDTTVTRYNATLVETVLKKYNDRGPVYAASESVLDEADDAQEEGSASSTQEDLVDETPEEQNASSTEEADDVSTETEIDIDQETNTDTDEAGDVGVIMLES